MSYDETSDPANSAEAKEFQDKRKNPLKQGFKVAHTEGKPCTDTNGHIYFRKERGINPWAPQQPIIRATHKAHILKLANKDPKKLTKRQQIKLFGREAYYRTLAQQFPAKQ